MYKRTFLMLVISLGLLGIAAVSSALTIDETVTPAYTAEHPRTFSVKAERRNDGLIHFTITYQLSRPTYLVMNSDISAEGHILFQATSMNACKDKSAIYQLAINPTSLASARFALELQAQVFARPFREPRSDISDAFDDKFRTDVYWVNGLRASGEFVSEDAASDHQKFLRITHDNRTTFRIIRDDLGVELFGAGEDTRNYSDASDYLASVDVRMPDVAGTAWMGIRATPSLGGAEINGYKLGLRRNADGSISTIVSYQDGNRNETYYEGAIPGTDNKLPDWITLTIVLMLPSALRRSPSL